jgi:hypothetical protein
MLRRYCPALTPPLEKVVSGTGNSNYFSSYCPRLLTLNEPATTGRIVDRVEVKLDLTTDQERPTDEV